jgi:hypothetical protein
MTALPLLVALSEREMEASLGANLRAQGGSHVADALHEAHGAEDGAVDVEVGPDGEVKVRRPLRRGRANPAKWKHDDPKRRLEKAAAGGGDGRSHSDKVREEKEAAERDEVTPVNHNGWCQDAPELAESRGFLFVANNPAVLGGLPDTSRCSWPGWTAIHFNDCKLAWPKQVTGLKHILVRRRFEGGFWGNDKACEVQGIHISRVLKMNGPPPNAKHRLDVKEYTHPHAGKSPYLSSGVSLAMSLRDCFPKMRRIAVGFDFHANGTDDGGKWHDFPREALIAKRLHLFERFVDGTHAEGQTLPSDLLLNCTK